MSISNKTIFTVSVNTSTNPPTSSLVFFADAKEMWRESHGFNKNGSTYVLNDKNTYEIRETLRRKGFIYDAILNWHTDNPNISVEDLGLSLLRIDFDDIYKWEESTQKPILKAEAEKIIEKKIKSYNHLLSNSHYVGEIGEKIPFTVVKFIKSIRTMKGYLYIFEDEYENRYRFFSQTHFSLYSDFFHLKGTVIDHKDDYGIYTTILSKTTLNSIESNPSIKERFNKKIIIEDED